MFSRVFAGIFGVSEKTINFVADHRRRYLRRLLIIIPLTVWTTIFYQLNPIFLKWQIDSLTGNWKSLLNVNLNDTWNVFLWLIGLYFLFSCLDKLFNFLKNRALFNINQDTESYLEDKFTNFLSRFDGAFLSSENNLRLIRNLQWSLSDIERKFTEVIQKFVESVFGLGALIFILPLIHPYLLALIALSVTLEMSLDYIQNQSWRQFELLESRQNEQRNELKWRIIWYFNQILASNWLSRITDIYSQRRNKYFQTTKNQHAVDRIFNLIKDFLSLATYSASALIAGYLFLTGKIPIGTFVVFAMYIERLKSQVQNFAAVFRGVFELRFELFRFDFLLHIQPKMDLSNIQKFQTDKIDKIIIKNLDFKYPEFFQEELDYLRKMQARVGVLNKIDEGKYSSEDKKQKTGLFSWLEILKDKLLHQSVSLWNRKKLQGELAELEDMFGKAGQNQLILKSLNIEMKKGQIYGLVGYNGAGKTTLTKLIKRIIDPTGGEILIETAAISKNNSGQSAKSSSVKSKIQNPVSLKTIDPIIWKKYLSSLEQQNFLWDSLSVKENLLLGLEPEEVKKITDEKIWEAIEKVGLKDKITNLEVILGEGLELSGGQQQLLEIARVCVQKRPIIILDEGTNQLDAVKESQIMSILKQLKKESIIIFITHRMTTCKDCDELLVLENGKLTAKGSPQELLQSPEPNLFQKFWNLQVEGKEVKN